MQPSTPSLQLILSPDTVYTTTVAGQYSFAGFTLTVTNTGDDVEVASVSMLLPTNLYLDGSLSSIVPVAGDPSDWNFGASPTPGAFQAMPSAGQPVPMPAGASFTFMLNKVTLAQKTGTASVQAVVKLNDGTKIPQTFDVTIAKATAGITFTAEPTNIAPGQNATLRWQCSQIDYCILTPPPNTNHLPATGSANVSPETSTTYTLDAYGTGIHLQSQVNVQVTRPQVLDFSADDDFVDYNGYAALNWTTEFADSVKLTAAPQVPIPPNLPINTTKAIPVGPLTQATTFTLTPISSTVKGSSSSPLIIDINPPTATFSASPTDNVWQKDKVTITWDITNAASITVDPPLPSGPSMQNLSGSLDIYPESNVSYKLTVTGVPGTPTIVETIGFSVTPVTAKFSVFPAIITPFNPPNQATLSWQVQAQVINIDHGIGQVQSAGTKLLTAPANGTVYTLTAGTVQNPALVTAQVTIVNKYGPFVFTAMQQQELDHQMLAVSFNVGPGLPPSQDYFNIQYTGISINAVVNPVYRSIVYEGSGMFGFRAELGTSVTWADPNNHSGTITILGIVD